MKVTCFSSVYVADHYILKTSVHNTQHCENSMDAKEIWVAKKVEAFC